VKKKIIPLIVIIFFTFCFFVFLKGLYLTNNYQPKENIEKKIPSFSGKNLFDNKLVNSDELFEKRNFYLLNIWASWCVPCRQEHQYLKNISKITNFKMIGLNYKDKKENAEKFLDELGNPYDTILRDKNGIKSIFFGAFGVPETFIIDSELNIVRKYIGPLNSENQIEIEKLLK